MSAVKIFHMFLFLIWFHLSQGLVLESETKDDGIAVLSTTCGEVVSGNVGLINYKLGQPLNNSERCIWTVQTGNFSQISLKIVSHGFKKDENIKIASTQSVSSANYLDISDYLSPFHGLEKNVTGNLVYVVFETRDSNVSTGFALLIEGFGSAQMFCSDYELIHQNVDDTPHGSFDYRLNHYQNDSRKCMFPVLSHLIQVGQSNSFILTLKNFVNGNDTSYVHLDYVRQVHVYEFFPDYIFTIVSRVRFGNTDPGPFTTVVKNPIVILYTSNSAENMGISLDISWTSVGKHSPSDRRVQ